jgi:hypothetical protein
MKKKAMLELEVVLRKVLKDEKLSEVEKDVIEKFLAKSANGKLTINDFKSLARWIFKCGIAEIIEQLLE